MKEKPLTEFYRKNGKHRSGWSGACKICTSLSQKASRVKTADKRRDQRAEWRNGRLAVIEKLKDVPCKDCGNRFPACCMDFDHIDPSTKTASVSLMLNMRMPMGRILEETRKCEVVCANCHRIRTHRLKRHDGSKVTGRPEFRLTGTRRQRRDIKTVQQVETS